jgi:hypothetical protein
MDRANDNHLQRQTVRPTAFQVLLGEYYPRISKILIRLLEGTVQGGSAQEVQRRPRGCAGASAISGMWRLGPLLRELKRQGLQGLVSKATQLCHAVWEESRRIHQFLGTPLADQSSLAGKNRP